ncbi:MAG: lipid A biosynthesis acyltransferase [Draconibacterium sp.]|nr:MAG: lipid A biosynthesis acyltransferase [Draconibacterium sp.]
MNDNTRNQLESRDRRYREPVLQRVLNKMGVGLLIGLSHLPFWLLYRISDVLYLLLRFVVRYRYTVITTNLRNAFPEKTEREISTIRKKFYRHFCDLIVETIKLYSIPEKQLKKRIEFKGIESCNEYFNRDINLIAMATHHNNWEWVSNCQPLIKHLILIIYNPIRGNYALEKFMLTSRERWGGKCVPVHKTVRTLFRYNAESQKTALWLAADQTPPANAKFWTMFLNQETPFFSGPEKIAHKNNEPVFFQYVKKTGRGRYSVEFIPLCENPAETKPGDILLAYIRKTEEVIKKEPEYYLWSHRRWKHKRPEGTDLVE